MEINYGNWNQDNVYEIRFTSDDICAVRIKAENIHDCRKKFMKMMGREFDSTVNQKLKDPVVYMLK